MEDHLNYLIFIVSTNGEQNVRIKRASERMPAVKISCRRQLTIRPVMEDTSGQIADKHTFKQKRKAQKQRKSSVSELFDLVTRTGIENLGALFVTCRDMRKCPKIRGFRTIHKSPFMLFYAKFSHH